jgi:HAD superfamily hydrolase (TIGR01509 family)
MKIKTILFDLDGTLVDTEPAAAYAVSQAFKSWDVDVTGEDAAYVTGRTWEKAFEYLFRKYKLPVSLDVAAEFVIGEYRKALREKLVVVGGGAEAVQALAPSYPLGLVSGSHRQEIFYALDFLKIRRHFKVVLGAEDYKKSKPDPEGYLQALKLLGAKAEETLIFEDSEPGIASARAAGAWVVAISGTNHFRQNTSAAHHSIADLSGVSPQWVAALESQLR